MISFFVRTFATGTLLACSLVACTPSTGDYLKQRKQVIEYQQSSMPPRLDEVLSAEPRLSDNAIAQREATLDRQEIVASIEQPILDPESSRGQMRARMGSTSRSPAFYSGEELPSDLRPGRTVSVKGQIVAARPSSMGLPSEVIVWDGEHEFQISDPVVRQALLGKVGHEVDIRGRVVRVDPAGVWLKVDTYEVSTELAGESDRRRY
jgi:hypothetical protein